jgi:hypothetical protein
VLLTRQNRHPNDLSRECCYDPFTVAGFQHLVQVADEF